MPKIDYLPDDDGSFILMAHLIASAIPDRENFYRNKEWSKSDIANNIRFVTESLAIELYCAVSDNFETEKLKAYILDKNYKYLEKFKYE